MPPHDADNARSPTARPWGMSLTLRKRLAILLLLVGLPVYIVVAVNVVELFDRPHPALELLVFVVLGIVWAFPFRTLFRGVAAAPPADAATRDTGPRQDR